MPESTLGTTAVGVLIGMLAGRVGLVVGAIDSAQINKS